MLFRKESVAGVFFQRAQQTLLTGKSRTRILMSGFGHWQRAEITCKAASTLFDPGWSLAPAKPREARAIRGPGPAKSHVAAAFSLYVIGGSGNSP